MSSKQSQIYFGGPDAEKNLLRDLLLEKIHLSQPGSKIIWVCYYLNDPLIIDALILAAQKNVYVDVIIDSNPRYSNINDELLRKLSISRELNVNITRIKLKKIWNLVGIRWHPHLHSKLYYFSSPHTQALIGSYNPTAGSEHLDDKQLKAIGDHSISHNVLASIVDPYIISKLLEYAAALKSTQNKLSRFTQLHNRVHTSNQLSINFLPTFTQHPIERLLTKKDDNTSIKCAISHFKGPGILRSLKNALNKGKKIEIVLERSERRISKHHLQFLDKHSIQHYQPELPNHCLMHNKFIIYKSSKEHCVMFGSFNWSTRSKYLNHEIIACTDIPEIVQKFEMRWHNLISN